MVEPDPRPGVDVVGGAETLLIGAHRLAEERHQDPVDDEPRAIRRDDDLLVHLGRDGADGGLRVVARRRAPDQLDQRHDRDRAEEVHADEPGPARFANRRRKPIDRDRRRVRGEDRAFRGAPIEVRPECRLHRHVLEHRLDHEVDLLRRCEVIGRRDQREDSVALGGIEAALRDRSLEVPGNPIAAGDGPVDVRLVERYRSTGRGEHLGDPVTHEAGAGHEGALVRHRLRLPRPADHPAPDRAPSTVELAAKPGKELVGGGVRIEPVRRHARQRLAGRGSQPGLVQPAT